MYILSLVFYLFLLSPIVPQEADSLISFSIEDQFDVVHQRSDYAGKIVIVFGSDRDGSSYNDDWAEPIADSLKASGLFEQVGFIGLADLGSVPYLMRSFVRSMMPADKNQHPILLDWQGKFSKAYNFRESHSNMIIFDQAFNKLTQKALKKVQQDTLLEIIRIIVDQIKNE